MRLQRRELVHVVEHCEEGGDAEGRNGDQASPVCAGPAAQVLRYAARVRMLGEGNQRLQPARTVAHGGAGRTSGDLACTIEHGGQAEDQHSGRAERNGAAVEPGVVGWQRGLRRGKPAEPGDRWPEIGFRPADTRRQ